MSVIYNTLERLKNDTRQKEAETQKARKSRNVISFDKIASSLPRLLLAGLLVMALGVATYYVIEDLANDGAESDNEIVRPETIPELFEEVHLNENNTPPQINAIEPSETEPPGNLERLGNPHELSGKKMSAPGEIPPAAETVDADYLPPRRQANNNLHSQKRMETQVAQYSQPAITHAAAVNKQDMEPAQASQKDSEQQNLLPDNEPVEQKVPAKISTAPISKASRPAVHADNVPKSVYYEPPGPAETVAIHETAFKHNPAGRQSGTSESSDSKYYRQAPFESSAHETTDTMQQEKMQQDKMHLATVKKNSRICRLLSETQKSLLSKNDSRTESLLNELNSYKGQDDEYVMRLRAFWHLKRGRYDSAESLLDLLLQKDENDLESGINMAVLEIKTNRLDQAQERLERLRRIYADNTQIPSILKKIRKQ